MKNSKRKRPIKCYEGRAGRINVTSEFIKKNKLSLVRTVEEIKERLDIQNEKLFSFEPEILINYLPYKVVRDCLTDEAKKKYDKNPKKWDSNIVTDIKETAQDFLDYMVFAWDKAYDERGISASRSVQKLGCWLWLMGRDDLRRIINDDELYNPYGTPALIAVCNEMGIDIPDWLVKFSKKKC